MRFEDDIFMHEISPKLDGSLKPTTPIYRIIDFFSAAQLIRDHHLYVPLSTQFNDNNEGIENSLWTYATAAGPCAGITPHFRSNEEFIENQRLQQISSYVSCWTQQRESVAMWALYSADHCSVQITTTIEKLSSAFNTLARNEYNPFELTLDNDETRNLVISASIMPVRYMSIINLGRQIDRRRRAYDKLERLGKINSETPLKKESSRDKDRVHQYRFAPFTLKDESFSHEREVRGILNMTSVDQLSLDEIQATLSTKDLSAAVSEAALNNTKTLIARHVAQEQSRKRGLILSQSMKLSTPHDFVSSVTIDPRCPPHKRTFMIDFLNAHNVHMSESQCFGYAADHLSIVPRAKLI